MRIDIQEVPINDPDKEIADIKIDIKSSGTNIKKKFKKNIDKSPEKKASNAVNVLPKKSDTAFEIQKDTLAELIQQETAI